MNRACDFVVDNGNGIRFVCVRTHNRRNPVNGNKHFMQRDEFVIDPYQDNDTDEWTGAFWYAASCAILLTAFIGVLMAAFVLYFMGEFQ